MKKNFHEVKVLSSVLFFCQVWRGGGVILNPQFGQIVYENI